MLVEGGAALDFQDRWGCVGLIEAVKNKRLEVVELLVASGAGVHVKDEFGKDALDYAEPDVAQILLVKEVGQGCHACSL